MGVIEALILHTGQLVAWFGATVLLLALIKAINGGPGNRGKH